MTNKELSKEESLELITSMINKAKENVAKGGSFYFLLWGWMVLCSNLGHYLIATYHWYQHPYIVWLSVIPTALISMMYGAKRGKKKLVKNHLDHLCSFIWLAIFIGMMIILVFMSQVNYNITPLILILSGVGTFISGIILRFRPLVLGGVALWIASIFAFNFNPIDQYLIGAIAMLFGYLIPGYLLRKIEK